MSNNRSGDSGNWAAIWIVRGIITLPHFFFNYFIFQIIAVCMAKFMETGQVIPVKVEIQKKT
jgi:hypothetical protein